MYMENTTAGFTYAFLIIPLLFALVVAAQGIDKVRHKNTEGYVGIGFGIFFVIVIIVAYFTVIR